MTNRIILSEGLERLTEAYKGRTHKQSRSLTPVMDLPGFPAIRRRRFSFPQLVFYRTIVNVLINNKEDSTNSALWICLFHTSIITFSLSLFLVVTSVYDEMLSWMILNIKTTNRILNILLWKEIMQEIGTLAFTSFYFIFFRR